MTYWEKFFREKMILILNEKKSLLDIGGGLRVSKNKGNRYNPDREWLLPLLKNKDYKILDPVPDYQPDILGDIHHLPLTDNSQEAIVCLSVLEHVENPTQACQEIYRVLKPGGYCFIAAPFLYYYHAEKGYYHDYWRFTHDAWQMLFKSFKTVEICPIRGAIATWLRISPLGKYSFLTNACNFLDILFKKTNSRQTSGYNIFLVK